MTALVTNRVHKLSESLVELKWKVREAMATELATAVGTAVRDILVVALLDRLVNIPSRTVPTPAHAGGWRDDKYDRWGDHKDPWDNDAEYDRPGTSSRYEPEDCDAEEEPPRAVPAAAAVALGVQVGKWWLARQGTISTAVGLGVLASVLGFAGGPVARAALAVLATATDLLNAESALSRLDRS